MKIYSMFQATIQICAQFILNYIILDLLTDIYQLLKTKGLQQKNNQHNVMFFVKLMLNLICWLPQTQTCQSLTQMLFFEK